MSKEKITDEQQLIAECIKGKPLAQKAIYDKYASSMMSVCIRYVTNRETAQDILQDGFVKLFTKIETFSGKGVFAGWVRRIFVTTALEHLRRKDTLKHSASIDEVGYMLDNDDVSIVDKISADDLMQCIATLSAGYRTVFNLYDVEGFSHTEISNMLNISESTSRSQFMRARKILQESIMLLYGKEYAQEYK